jgi:hypothetical protein
MEWVAVEGAHMGGLKREAVAFFAAAQGRLGALPLGNVHGRAGDPQQGVVGPVQGAASVFEPVDAAVRPDGSIDRERIPSLVLRCSHLDLEGRPIVRVNCTLEGGECPIKRAVLESVQRLRLGRPGLFVGGELDIPGIWYRTAWSARSRSAISLMVQTQ